jgi:hypothetical protein
VALKLSYVTEELSRTIWASAGTGSTAEAYSKQQ